MRRVLHPEIAHKDTAPYIYVYVYKYTNRFRILPTRVRYEFACRQRSLHFLCPAYSLLFLPTGFSGSPRDVRADGLSYGLLYREVIHIKAHPEVTSGDVAVEAGIGRRVLVFLHMYFDREREKRVGVESSSPRVSFLHLVIIHLVQCSILSPVKNILYAVRRTRPKIFI